MTQNLIRRSILIIAVLIIIIFIIEMITPQGVGESILYVAVILVSLSSRNRKLVYSSLILCSILTVVGFFLSPVSIEPWKSVFNRFFAITVFWIVALVGLKRLQTEESLQESELRFQNVFDNMMEGAQLISFDWRYIYVNEEVAKQGHQSRENLLGRTMMEVYHGIENTYLFSVLRNCMQERTSYQMENKFTYPNGQSGWFELNIQPVPEGLFIVSNDITDRKLVEHEIYQLNLNLEERIRERTLELNTANDQLKDELTSRRQAEKMILQQMGMLSNLHQITLDLLKHQELKQLLQKVVELSANFLDASYTEIMLAEEDSLKVHASTENQKHLIGKNMSRNEAVLSWQSFDERKPVVIQDYATWPHRKDIYNEFSLHAAAGFPILSNDQSIGVLGVARNEPNYEFTEEQIQFGSLFASLTALIITNTQLRESLKQQSIRDPLTGLFNRRYMEEMLKREVSRVTRQLHSLGIIMIDIDYFKRFNDTFGHATGDKLLRDVGRFLQGHVRGDDIACRYGGEEFILIMPDAYLETVRQRAEQLCREIKNLKIEGPDQMQHNITLSLGVAMYPEHGRTMDQVIQAADAALYKAKQNGRNQVVVATKNS